MRNNICNQARALHTPRHSKHKAPRTPPPPPPPPPPQALPVLPRRTWRAGSARPATAVQMTGAEVRAPQMWETTGSY
eukprot:2232919-Pleurochrysis_carterae.AAC.3